MHTSNDTHEESRQRLAAEVLELGESLFETALEIGSYKPAEGEESTVYPLEDLRATAHEFFTALRLLLKIEEM